MMGQQATLAALKCPTTSWMLRLMIQPSKGVELLLVRGEDIGTGPLSPLVVGGEAYYLADVPVHGLVQGAHHPTILGHEGVVLLEGGSLVALRSRITPAWGHPPWCRLGYGVCTRSGPRLWTAIGLPAGCRCSRSGPPRGRTPGDVIACPGDGAHRRLRVGETRQVHEAAEGLADHVVGGTAQ